MSSAAGGAAAALLATLKASTLVNYTAVACSAMLCADYLQTLPDEITYMWAARMSVVKVLFLLVRYYPFLHTTLSLLRHAASPISTPEVCLPLSAAIGYSSIFLTWICDAVSFVRVYAFAGRTKALLFFLIPWYIAVRAVELGLAVTFTRSLRFANSPFDGRVGGCFAVAANGLMISLIYTVVLISLASVTAVMVYVGWRKWREQAGRKGAASLFHIFLRDGVLYFICIFSIGILNIIFNRAAPKNGTNLTMMQVQVHVNAMLTGRMLIYLRAYAQRDLDLTGGSSFEFQPRPWSTRFSTNNTKEDVRFAPYDSTMTKSVPTLHVNVRTEMTITDRQKSKVSSRISDSA